MSYLRGIRFNRVYILVICLPSLSIRCVYNISSLFGAFGSQIPHLLIILIIALLMVMLRGFMTINIPGF